MTTLKTSLLFILFSVLASGCNQPAGNESEETGLNENVDVLSMLTGLRTTQYFSDEPVPPEDITVILDAGRNAYSGRNMQAWYFGAIINQDLIGEIAGTMTMGPPPGAPGTPPPAFPKAGFADAPAAIAVAGDPNNSFSTGLACQNMVIAATALGYGTKIVMGGADQLNSDENRALLQIPGDLNVVVILMVGKADTTIDMTADGVTGASTRKPLTEVSSIIQ